MFATFREISLRHLATHKLRTALTVLGVALGIAGIVGMWLVEEGASEAFQRNIEQIAGRAQLVISNGQVGLPEPLLDDVTGVAGVEAVAASVQGFVSLANMRGERLYLFGIDLLADRKVRDYDFDSSSSSASIQDPLVFLAQPNSVALTTTFLEKYGLRLGDQVTVRSARGPQQLKIRGVLKAQTGPASIFGGRLALMDIFAAERVLGLDHRFTQIDVVPKRGSDLVALEAALVKAVNGRGIVERSARRSRAFETSLAGFRTAYTLSGTLAVAVGIYLVFNTMMISVTQRRREIGILRAVGMRRIEVLELFATEAVLLGAMGALVGIALGVAFAVGITPVFNAMMGLPGYDRSGLSLGTSPTLLLWGFAFGVGGALLATLPPTLEAAQVQPVEAMRRVRSDAGTRSYRKLGLAGVASIAVAFGALACGFVPALRGPWTAIIEQGGFLLGVSLLAPAFLQALAAQTAKRINVMAHPLVALASRSMATDVHRTAITAAALAVSIAGATGMASILASVTADLGKQLDLAFHGFDLIVASSVGLFNPAEPKNLLPMPRSLVDEIGELPGVAEARGERWASVPCEGSSVNLIVSEGPQRGLQLIAGRASAAGQAEVTIGEKLARRRNLGVGEMLRFETPGGERSFRISGIGYDASPDSWVGIDSGIYRREWRDDSVNQILVGLSPGANAERVSDEIRERFGDRYGLSVLATATFYRDAKNGLKAGTAGAYPINALAIAIALLGVVNSLLATVIDRTHEIGVLRATVATRREIVSILVIEAVTLGAAGAILGVGVGSLLGFGYMRDVYPILFEHLAAFHYAAGAAVFALVSSILLSAAAGYLPGRSAARLRVVEALAYE